MRCMALGLRLVRSVTEIGRTGPRGGYCAASNLQTAQLPKPLQFEFEAISKRRANGVKGAPKIQPPAKAVPDSRRGEPTRRDHEVEMVMELRKTTNDGAAVGVGSRNGGGNGGR